MILSVAELFMLKPMLNLVAQAHYTNAVLVLSSADQCKTTLEVSVNGILLRQDSADSPPTLELYKHPMGLAQAYRVPLALIAPTEED